jgi:hypothetical protein
LLIEEGKEISRRRTRRSGNAETDENTFAGELIRYFVADALRGLENDLATTFRTESVRDSRHQQFQIVIDLGERADRRARRANAVSLLDSDGRGDTADLIHQRFIHPLQKLARVRAKRLDVPPLSLRINRIESETRFAAAARPGHDMKPVQLQIQVDSLQVILPRASDHDRGRRRVFPHRKIGT